MKQLFISTFAAAVMLLFGGVNEVNADPLEYQIEGETVAVISCDKNASGELVIPSTYEGKKITSIGSAAFAQCTSLTSVKIPEGVSNIGRWAFSSCSSLTSVEIPDTVLNIGDSAFAGCSSLASVTIPKSVTSIGKNAFMGCASLTGIDVGEGNRAYSSQDGVLFNFSKTDLIQFPSRKNGNYMIPSGVIRIGEWAFSESTLEVISIPNSVYHIGRRAFAYCRNLKSISISNNLTGIQSGTFYGCSSLKSISIPASVSFIDDRSFSNCNSFTSIVIPNGVVSIGKKAFWNCINLKNISLPNSLLIIKDNPFAACYRLQSITVHSNNPNFASEGAIIYNKSKTVLLSFPSYFTGDFIIPERVEYIAGYAFSSCNLASVSIPESVNFIGYGAFESCRNLTSISIPNGVENIGIEAFADCQSLKNISLPNSVSSIQQYAFASCTSLSTINIPKSVESIGDNIFRYCANLKTINFMGDYPNEIKCLGQVHKDAKIFIEPNAKGFGSRICELPVFVKEELKINAFSKSASPFSLTFETKSDSTYKIEASHDLKKWGEIGEVQGTGSSVKFTDPRLPIVPFERNYFRVKLVE
ncbi:leucine-rich repeat domain-containing protein [bacterium]|nr:leucine-rich repeat domain-containing protein [bacterium]